MIIDIDQIVVAKIEFLHCLLTIIPLYIYFVHIQRKPPFVKIDGECLVPSGNETALKLAVLSQPVSVVITISDEFRSYRGVINFFFFCGGAG